MTRQQTKHFTTHLKCFFIYLKALFGKDKVADDNLVYELINNVQLLRTEQKE